MIDESLDIGSNPSQQKGTEPVQNHQLRHYLTLSSEITAGSDRSWSTFSAMHSNLKSRGCIISVSSRVVEDNELEIFFTVKDTGIGISQDNMNELFEPFTKLERTISRKRDGVGLGLAITKNLVELMGGRIWAENPRSGHGLPLHDFGRNHPWRATGFWKN
jgi:hypothetical protein